ncbi:MAG: hypothetical protein SynsKO_00670 [Synoicihabitans sp.]
MTAYRASKRRIPDELKGSPWDENPTPNGYNESIRYESSLPLIFLLYLPTFDTYSAPFNDEKKTVIPSSMGTRMKARNVLSVWVQTG